VKFSRAPWSKSLVGKFPEMEGRGFNPAVKCPLTSGV
jgi:hypothetical protein